MWSQGHSDDVDLYGGILKPVETGLSSPGAKPLADLTRLSTFGFAELLHATHFTNSSYEHLNRSARVTVFLLSPNERR